MVHWAYLEDYLCATSRYDKVVSMDITPATAVALRDAFGDCSVVYECMTTEEIVAGVSECDSVEYWLQIRLDVESIFAEREGCYADWKKMKPGILTRLAILGYTPTK